MDKCPHCNHNLRCKTELESDEGSTKIYAKQDYYCINKKCTHHVGIDISKPAHIIKTERPEYKN